MPDILKNDLWISLLLPLDGEYQGKLQMPNPKFQKFHVIVRDRGIGIRSLELGIWNLKPYEVRCNFRCNLVQLPAS